MAGGTHAPHYIIVRVRVSTAIEKPTGQQTTPQDRSRTSAVIHIEKLMRETCGPSAEPAERFPAGSLLISLYRCPMTTDHKKLI